MTSPWNDPPPTPGGDPGGSGGYPAGPPQHAGPTGYPAGPPQHDGPSFLGGPGGPGTYPTHPGDAGATGYGGPPAAPSQPGPLKTAVTLMWVGAGLALLNMLSTFLFIDDIRETTETSLRDSDQAVTDSTIDAAVTIGIIFAVVFGLVAVGLWAWMAVMNGKGKGWARVTATVFGGIGILFGALGLLGSGIGAEQTPLSLVSSIVNLILAIAILVLLWNSQNAAYYRANS